MLSIHYCWLDHTGDPEWLPKFYPNINEDENHFKNEQEDIIITNLIHNSSFALKYAKEKNLQYACYNNDLIKSLKKIVKN